MVAFIRIPILGRTPPELEDYIQLDMEGPKGGEYRVRLTAEVANDLIDKLERAIAEVAAHEGFTGSAYVDMIERRRRH